MHYHPYYQTYIDLVPFDDVTAVINNLKANYDTFQTFITCIPVEKYEYQYAENKWTLRQILQHLIDCERIFNYRALRISRNDLTPLMSFEENKYAATAIVTNRTVADLLAELSIVRASSIALYQSFDSLSYAKKGMVSGELTSVDALIYITYGHLLHHQQIYNIKYLDSV